MKKMNGDRTLSMLQQQALLQLKENVSWSPLLVTHLAVDDLHLTIPRRNSSQPDFRKRVQDLVLSSETLKRGLSGNLLLASLKEELEKTLVDDATLKLWEVICSREGGMATLLEACVQAAHTEVLSQGILEQQR
jgi:hypothetical protein